MIEAQLLSKVIDENKFHELSRYKVGADDFPTLSPVYVFVRDYVKDNGSAPDYRTVAASFPEFEYFPEVVDGYKYLATRLKAQTAKRQMFELLQHETKTKFKELDGAKFAEWISGEVARIASQSSATFALGQNFAENGDVRKAWYDEAKENRTFMYVPTPYGSLTKALGGGFELGDYVLLMAFTNRGKSWIASDIGLKAWLSGFGVLHYSPELSQRQQSLRLDTLAGHFNNVEIRRGALDKVAEKRYKEEYLAKFTPDSKFAKKAPYLIKTMEDLPHGLTLEVIEQDLRTLEGIQMVIIDGFSLIRHSSKRGGHEAKEETSRMLRQLFGQFKVAGIVVHQTPGAAEKDKGKDEDKTRLVKPPKLVDYSGSIATIQDAATVLTFDQAEGIGKISVEKAREPSVGTLIELSCNFNLGYIKEQDATSHF
jgi:replicative DNA helicase